ncbi:acetyltransferase [Levilactobacillus suantsaii]|uniref:Acetyltransferase n=1 Tax=Levilactobacillus suantsaii TaxID=2292255 RepID=A0A4Q0VK93_9LACO|nr:acetyltransferase [Levilactobacillus suantsaii]QMU07140.1 acetyltransferase [Levilactobacillus suantsaii]RXI80087.1 acetyltransferase [Levilactobacillus suantsaii]
MTLATVWNHRLEGTGTTVRALTHADDDLIYEFQAQHPEYFGHFQDHPVTRREAVQDVEDVPLNATADQKAYLGVFDHDRLVLIVDLIIDYPLPSLVWLGLWLPDKQLSRAQQGELYQSLVQTLLTVDAVQLQLSVFMGDRDAPTFWTDQGLTQVQRTTVVRGSRSANVTIYQDKFDTRTAN